MQYWSWTEAFKKDRYVNSYSLKESKSSINSIVQIWISYTLIFYFVEWLLNVSAFVTELLEPDLYNV